VFVDVGTTLMVVPPIVMNAIQKSFVALCNGGNGNLVGVCGMPPGTSLFDGKCFAMTDKQKAAFPSFTLNIYGWGNVPFESSYYLWEGQPGLQCLGIQNSGDLRRIITIGAILLQKYHLFFDRYNQQIGLADKSTCPSPTSNF
jgi:hypothetical protein